jgi:hypothetical protein
VPLGYVIVGVTVYCALVWAVAITGVRATVHALNPGPDFVASSGEHSTPRADASE